MSGGIHGISCLSDPSARTMAQTGSRYQQHHDEDVDDENIFRASGTSDGVTPVDGEEERPAAIASSSNAADITMRRPSGACVCDLCTNLFVRSFCR